MPLYALGISRSRDVPSAPEKTMAGSVGVHWSHAGELACALVEAPHNAFQPLHHAAALEAIHRHICVLPMRFGVAVHDRSEIRSVLQARSGELLDQLDSLDGACEMAVRITWPSLPSTVNTRCCKDSSPVAYLEQRRGHYQRVDAATERDRLTVRRFVERLQGLYRAWRGLPPWPSQPIRLAFLVERDRVAAFRSRSEDPRHTCWGECCTVLGPWPPYSFV